MRIIAFFRTLRGKLILTYTSVTVLALLALEVTVLLFVVVFSHGMNTDTYEYLADVVSVLPPQARVYLQPGANDLDGLQSWLQATYEAGYASLPAEGPLDSPAAPILKSEPMYVIAPDGTVLAAAPADARGLVGRVYSPPSNVAQAQSILTSALQLDLKARDVSAIRPDGNYLLAVPVRQSQGEGPLAAVIIVTVKGLPAGLGSWWALVLGIVFATALILLLAVAPFGALFGFIMSRGLTRRLKDLTLAADAWSEGDFSVQPQDRSKDEISYLSGRMRRMAEHVQALLQTRQELTLLEERNRLARELHDTVKQETFATLMQVRAAKNSARARPGGSSPAPGGSGSADQVFAAGVGFDHHRAAPDRPGGSGPGRGAARLLDHLVSVFAHPGRISSAERAPPAAGGRANPVPRGAGSALERGPAQPRFGGDHPAGVGSRSVSALHHR